MPRKFDAHFILICLWPKIYPKNFLSVCNYRIFKDFPRDLILVFSKFQIFSIFATRWLFRFFVVEQIVARSYPKNQYISELLTNLAEIKLFSQLFLAKKLKSHCDNLVF